MAQFETWMQVDLKKPIRPQALTGTVFAQDSMANLIGVEVLDGGNRAYMAGSVAGKVIRADGATVAVAGSLSDNRAWIVLPAAAYAAPGQIIITISLTTGDTTTTLGACAGYVVRTSTDAIVDPGTIIPSIDALIAEIDAAIQSIPADYSDLVAAIAPNETSPAAAAHAVGEYFFYTGKLYKVGPADIKAGDTLTVGTNIRTLPGGLAGEVAAALNVLDTKRSIYYDTVFTDGGYISASDGSVVPYATWSYSDYIDVRNATTLRTDYDLASNYNAMYDADKNFIGNIQIAEGGNYISLDDNAAYIRISLRTGRKNTCHITLLPDQLALHDQLLREYQAYRVPLDYRYVEATYDNRPSGLNIVWKGNTIRVTGTTTAPDAFNVFLHDASNSPRDISWAKNNHTYYLLLHRTADDGAVFRLRTYVGSVLVDRFIFTGDAPFELQRADELTFLQIGMYVEAGQTVDNTLTYELLESPPLQYILNHTSVPEGVYVEKNTVRSLMTSGTAIGEVDGKTFYVPIDATGGVDLSSYYTNVESDARFARKDVLKLRVLQNNAGCWRYGRNPGALELTEEVLAQKIANYKRFFATIRPDVACFQEYVKYMGANDTHEAQVEIFDPLYQYRYIRNTTSKQRTVWTNHKCTTRLVTVQPSGSTYTEAILENHKVHVITFALHPGPDASDLTMRKNQMDQILSSVDNYTNVILTADLNVYSDEELTDMIARGRAHGFHSFFSGDWWGRYNSYINPPNQETPGSYYRKIDAIWCKGEMKMVNAKVLMDETTHYPDTYVWDPTDVTPETPNIMVADQYNDLASDHVPVMADFEVYGEGNQ